MADRKLLELENELLALIDWEPLEREKVEPEEFGPVMELEIDPDQLRGGFDGGRGTAFSDLSTRSRSWADDMEEIEFPRSWNRGGSRGRGGAVWGGIGERDRRGREGIEEQGWKGRESIGVRGWGERERFEGQGWGESEGIREQGWRGRGSIGGRGRRGSGSSEGQGRGGGKSIERRDWRERESAGENGSRGREMVEGRGRRGGESIEEPEKLEHSEWRNPWISQPPKSSVLWTPVGRGRRGGESIEEPETLEHSERRNPWVSQPPKSSVLWTSVGTGNWSSQAMLPRRGPLSPPAVPLGDLGRNRRHCEQVPENVPARPSRGYRLSPELEHQLSDSLRAMTFQYNHDRVFTFTSQVVEVANKYQDGRNFQRVVEVIFNMAPLAAVQGSLVAYARMCGDIANSVRAEDLDTRVPGSRAAGPPGERRVFKDYMIEKCHAIAAGEWSMNSTRFLAQFIAELLRREVPSAEAVLTAIGRFTSPEGAPDEKGVTTLGETIETGGVLLDS